MEDSFSGELHVLPVEDIEPHATKSTCPCRPTSDDDGATFVHHSFDRREYSEHDFDPRYPPKQ